jgi:hypothetical protein
MRISVLVQEMFRAEDFSGQFKGDIAAGDVSSVTTMRNVMFGGAERFNQNIGDWDVSKGGKLDGNVRRCCSIKPTP